MLCLSRMTDERLILAIGRLERALSRVETRLASDAPSPPPDTALAARHERLRAETNAAIEAIDRLIMTQEPR